MKWLAVAVDYKKEMSKITKDSNLKKFLPFLGDGHLIMLVKLF